MGGIRRNGWRWGENGMKKMDEQGYVNRGGQKMMGEEKRMAAVRGK